MVTLLFVLVVFVATIIICFMFNTLSFLFIITQNLLRYKQNLIRSSPRTFSRFLSGKSEADGRKGGAVTQRLVRH